MRNAGRFASVALAATVMAFAGPAGAQDDVVRRTPSAAAALVSPLSDAEAAALRSAFIAARAGDHIGFLTAATGLRDPDRSDRASRNRRHERDSDAVSAQRRLSQVASQARGANRVRHRCPPRGSRAHDAIATTLGRRVIAPRRIAGM